MTKTKINCLLLSIIFMAISCNDSNSSKSVTTGTVDTISTDGFYRLGKVAKHGTIALLVKDSLKIIPTDKDSVEYRKMWTRDTAFFLYLSDTLRDASGKPKLDSSGKSSIYSNWFKCDRSLIYCYGFVNSVYIAQIIKRDSLLLK